MNDPEHEIVVPSVTEESEDTSSRKGWRWLIGCVVLVAIIGAGLSQIPTPHDKDAYRQQFAQVKEVLAKQKEKDVALKKQLKAEATQHSSKVPPAISLPPPPPPPAPSAPEKAVDSLPEQFILAQEALIASQAEVKALQEELAFLREQKAIQQLLWRNYYSLDQRIAAGKPFVKPLKTLLAQRADLSQESVAALVRLQPYAKNGVMTLSMLKAEFAQATEAYYTAYPLHGVGGTTEEAGLMRWLGGLVQVRKIGKQHVSDDDAARLARAEAALQQHDISAALQEVRSLSVKATPIFKEWRQQAFAHHDAVRAMRALTHAVIKE
jgi:hypothetical protein